MKKNIKSPLRYPGGKSRAIKKILPIIPENYKEFREPMVGGGSVFLAAKQKLNKNAIYKINDLNYDLYCFWKSAKNNIDELVERVQYIKDTSTDGRKLFKEFTDNSQDLTELERAVRFFVLNRITFSGTVDSGGYSEQSFKNRFTQSSIDRLALLSQALQNVIITHGDYTSHLFEDGDDVFIFLDPPYLSSTKSKLYGKNGDLHTRFNHKEFAENMKKCNHKWLITLDDSPEIREMFDFAYIYNWELQYGMNNYKQGKADKGKELFISNYELPILQKNISINIL